MKRDMNGKLRGRRCGTTRSTNRHTLRIHPSMVSHQLCKFPQREKDKRRQGEQKKTSIENHSEKSATTYPNLVSYHLVTAPVTMLAFI